MTGAAVTISVVIPARDAERFIGGALASVAAQTVRPHEVIVVDASSSDSTAAIARRAGATVISLPGARPGPARNAGIEAARGDLLAFLDADDRWRPTKLERQSAVLAAQPDVGFVGCLTSLFLDDPAEPPDWWNPRWSAGGSEPSLLPSAIVVRRGALAVAGLFADMRSEDVEWTARAQDLGVQRFVVGEVLVDRRVHPRSGSADHAAVAERHLRILRESIQRKRAKDDA